MFKGLLNAIPYNTLANSNRGSRINLNFGPAAPMHHVNSVTGIAFAFVAVIFILVFFLLLIKLNSKPKQPVSQAPAPPTGI